MPNILIVEDAKLFSNMLTRRIKTELGYDVLGVTSLAETQELMDSAPDAFDAAVLDLTLPDSYEGEIVDLVAPNIPSIVLTGNLSDDLRDSMWAKGIADYVLKEGTQNIDYVMGILRRIINNRHIEVLVVEDSKILRRSIRELLSVHKYNVLEANDGYEALEVLKEHPDVKLVITDYHMPKMDGFELTKRIRESFHKESLSIIGISAEGNNMMSARFIKNGANDFINKPFISEEFYCRITHNIEMLEHIDFIRDISNKDYLTKLYNRKYFFEVGGRVFKDAVKNKEPIIVAMADIDRFKSINDTYGHHAGDQVINFTANHLKNRFTELDTVARFGGEEFCILATSLDPESVERTFDQIRQEFEDAVMKIDGRELKFTVSFGVCTATCSNLEEMIKASDRLLYKAKNAGRNQVYVGGCG